MIVDINKNVKFIIVQYLKNSVNVVISIKLPLYLSSLLTSIKFVSEDANSAVGIETTPIPIKLIKDVNIL